MLYYIIRVNDKRIFFRIKEFESNPEYNEDIKFTDIDNDGISLETNEIKTTAIMGKTNFIGNENMDFGGGIGFSFGSVSIGLGYQGFLDNNILKNSNLYVVSYENNYNSDKKNNKTDADIKKQIKEKDYQHHFIFNFGIDKTDTYYDKNRAIIKIKRPVFLLESKFIIFKEHGITRNKYTLTTNDDPEGNISSSLHNKEVNEGSLTDPIEIDNISEGYKLQVKPKINIKANTRLNYNIQGNSE